MNFTSLFLLIHSAQEGLVLLPRLPTSSCIPGSQVHKGNMRLSSEIVRLVLSNQLNSLSPTVKDVLRFRHILYIYIAES